MTLTAKHLPLWQWITVASVLLMVLLTMLWELWLSPLYPGGSWLAAKALIMLLPLRGLLHGKRYTFQWYTMFVLLWLLEGIMRAYAEQGVGRYLALIQVVLVVVSYTTANLYAKYSAPSRMVKQ
ncbi:DUF2069 domain-containing protein [Chitinibacter fontanus]|uniref:DUF2069 domain-containing protein n=1 Tax=Chitinibacter fontanus TaxID=1737446 RepID=A0A7D5ZKJ6_9NEIS|nr:DUF2069 domain-containing protein [Chitinibacter fontanus]QLI81970.1 DUF2069 domain-containing protein [Chitinibacter fontanus]